MSSCSIAISKAKLAFQKSKERAESLMETMQVTKEGEVLAETVARAEYALAKLNEQDFTALEGMKRGELVNSLTGALLRQELTDVFEGSIAYNANSKTPRQDLVIKSAEFVDDTLVVTVTPKGQNKFYTYTFEPNSNVSNATGETGTRLFIPSFAQTFRHVQSTVNQARRGLTYAEQAKKAKEVFASLKQMVESTDDVNELLGSAAKAKPFSYKKASLRPNYVHGDREHMKNLLADLHALKDSPISEEEFDYLNDLLDQMHPHFFRDMNVYINENAEHTMGWVDIDKEHILLNVSSKRFEDMSNEEVYMHEVIHTMTLWALRQKGFDASRLRNRLNYLRKTAINNLTWQDFAKANPNLTTQEAKERFDYIFNSKNADDEFLAFALTNPSFRKLLGNIKLKDERKTGFLNAIKDFFVDLMNAVMGNYDFRNRNGKLDKEIHTLAFKLAEINQQAAQDVKDGNMFTMLSDLVDRTEGRFEEWATGVTDLLDSTSDVKIPSPMSRMQKIMFAARFFTKGVYNKNFRHAVGLYLSNLGVKPTNSIREAVRSVMPRLDNDYTIEFAGLKTNNIDAMRNTVVTATAKNIIEKFTRKLTEKEEVATTVVFLESNASTLFTKKYSTKQVIKTLSDTGFRKRSIGRVEAKIRKKAGKRANWIIGQAGGLGRLMATGKGHEAQNTNSKSIVIGYGTNERHALDKDLLSLVEELASLQALDHQNISELKVAADLLRTQEAGVRNVVNIYEAFKQQSAEDLFEDDAAHMLEGYTKELFDNTIEIKYEPLSDAAELAKLGYTLVSEVENQGLTGGKKLGIYVSDTYSQPERLRGAVGLGNPHSRGLSLKDIRYKQFGDSKKHAQIYFEADKITMNKKAKEINKQLEAGKSFKDIEDGSVPIIDATGNTVDYRNMMSKQLKAKFLGQDRGIASVLSKTTGSIVDKVSRAEQNEKVLEIIKKNIKEVYDNPSSADNLEEYTLVSANSNDPEIRKLFFMLPKSYQKFANSRADESLPIPTVLMDQYFGYQHYMFSNLPGVNRLPNTIKHVLNIFEAYWSDLVKIAKGNVLLKMPVVLVGNIVSNVVYAFNTGMPITEIVGAYRDSLRDVKSFMAAHKAIEEKKIELASISRDYMTKSFSPVELQEHNEKVKRLKDEIVRLDVEMSKNEVKELFDIGMYQSVVEDIEMYKLGDTNKVTDGMDKLLNKLPTVIKTPLQWAYLSKETAWYKVNQEVLQLSDLVARDVMNRKQKKIEEMQADGKKDLPLEYRKMTGKMTPRRRVLGPQEREEFFKIAERSRHANLLTSFVNYNLPNGRGEEYLNRIGTLMFTKYMKRIQNVITSSSIKHPIRTAVTLTATAFLMDIDKIQDQSLIVKGMDNNDFGIFGIVPWYSPADIVLNVATPPLVKLVY